MDSGNNSGSLQSSSGGDDEFDSRTFFATNANNTNGFSITNNNFPFLDNFTSFLDPPSPFPLRAPAPAPAPTPTPAPAPAPSNPLSSPRTTASSKKRSRASRRAPTTVLTTDTSNFRAMVQEFTGIPAPPFASASTPYPPPRSRFDFFNSGGGGGGFLLKPYPHKSFHFPNILNASTPTNTTTINGSSSTSSINYHLPPPPPPPSNFGLSNFQSLLHSQLAAKAQMMPTSTSTAAADYGSVGDLAQLTGVIGSGWGQDAAADPTAQLSNAGCKLNYSAAGAAAAADFGAEKGGEARGEGMVESWNICSSD